MGGAHFKTRPPGRIHNFVGKLRGEGTMPKDDIPESECQNLFYTMVYKSHVYLFLRTTAVVYTRYCTWYMTWYHKKYKTVPRTSTSHQVICTSKYIAVASYSYTSIYEVSYT